MSQMIEDVLIDVNDSIEAEKDEFQFGVEFQQISLNHLQQIEIQAENFQFIEWFQIALMNFFQVHVIESKLL
jgi:hypothetical protein